MAMFEFGRELRRWFGGAEPDPHHDGLTGGDVGLVELLELDMLRAEAKAADVAAGRISAKDRPQRQFESALVWREIARRTGDATALRKAAASAEQAAGGFGRDAKPRRWAAARVEQAQAALAGAALFGDDGLNAAADFAFAEAARTAGASLPGALAGVGRAVVEARNIVGSGDREAALRAAGKFDAPIRALDVFARRRGGAAIKLMAAGARIDRAELLSICGARLKDALLLRMALDALTRVTTALDADYEPLTWARAATATAQVRAALGELEGDIGAVSDAICDIATVLDHVRREHSPLDWANAQLALAGALVTLGDAGDSEKALGQALAAYDRALMVLADRPALPLRAAAAHGRVACLVRRAEITCDLKGLASAETALRQELALTEPAKDPVAWAVRQLSFAQIAEARAQISGADYSSTPALGLAISAALDVFAEHGLRSLTDAATRSLDRLKARAAQS